jgi:hypothetical protein
MFGEILQLNAPNNSLVVWVEEEDCHAHEHSLWVIELLGIIFMCVGLVGVAILRETLCSRF